MEPGRRRNQLLYGLRRTRADQVCVDAGHLIEALGLEKAERQIKELAGLVSAVRTAYSSRETIVHTGVCVVNRENLIQELERTNVQEAKAIIDKRMKR